MTSRVERIYSSVNTRVTLANGSGFVFFGADPQFSHRYKCIQIEDRIQVSTIKLTERIRNYLFGADPKFSHRYEYIGTKTGSRHRQLRYQSGSEIRLLTVLRIERIYLKFSHRYE